MGGACKLPIAWNGCTDKEEFCYKGGGPYSRISANGNEFHIDHRFDETVCEYDAKRINSKTEGVINHLQWRRQFHVATKGALANPGEYSLKYFPKIYENLERQTRQDTLFKQLGLQQQQETYNSKQGLIDAQTGNYQSEVANRNLQGILNIDKNKRDNFNDDPDIFQIKNTKRITKEQANRLNAKYGSNLTPSAWVAYVEKIDPVTGASIIRPDDDPRYSTNPTVGADLSKKVVPVNINGIDTAMTGTDLAHAQIAEAGANASRQAQTELHNSTQAFEAARTNAAARTANMKAIADNNKAKVTQSAGNLTNLSEVQALNGNMARIAEQMQQKTDDLNNPKLDKEATQKAIDKLNEDFNTASTKFGEALGKTNGGIALQTELNSFVPPAVEMVNAKPITPVHTDYIRPTTPPPGTSKGGKNNNIATPDAYRKALKRVGGR